MGKTENLSISIRISSKWLWLLLFRENWWDEIIRLSSWKLWKVIDIICRKFIVQGLDEPKLQTSWIFLQTLVAWEKRRWLYWKIWLKLIKHPLLPFGLSKHLKCRNSKLCMSEWVTTIKACMYTHVLKHTSSTDVSLPFACFVILFKGRDRLDSLRFPRYPVEFLRCWPTCWVIRGDGLALGTRAVPSSISSVGGGGNWW